MGRAAPFEWPPTWHGCCRGTLVKSLLNPDPEGKSVEQSPPIRANAIATTLNTAIARGKCQRSRRETTGASKKLIRIARISGSKNSFAQAKAARMRTRYATWISLRTSNGFSEMRLLMSFRKGLFRPNFCGKSHDKREWICTTWLFDNFSEPSAATSFQFQRLKSSRRIGLHAPAVSRRLTIGFRAHCGLII